MPVTKPPIQMTTQPALTSQKVFQTVNDGVSVSYDKWFIQSIQLSLVRGTISGKASFMLYGTDEDGNTIPSPFPPQVVTVKDALNDPDLSSAIQDFMQAFSVKAQNQGVIS